MRRTTIATFTLLAVLTAPAVAEPRAAHPQPTPAARTEAADPEDPVRAASKAQQDAFDKRIAGRSERAMRSICSGCDTGPARARPAGPRRAEAKAGPADEPGDDFVVDEPAEAPGN